MRNEPLPAASSSCCNRMAPLLLPQLLLMLLLLGATGAPVAAQEPIGSPSACGAGKTDRVLCFVDEASGYLADVQFRNSERTTLTSLCGGGSGSAQRDTQPRVLELSAADYVVRFRACADAGGLRGLAFRTALGEVLTCGRVPDSNSGTCKSFSSRSSYPLRGFQGTCAGGSGARQRHTGGSSSGTRVTSITAACWTPQRQVPLPTRECPPGFGVQGGGLPCQACPINSYSPGGSSPCKPCPPTTTTLTTGQAKCGCFPGQGVYGPVNQDPDVCETCPAGTYAIGGTLSPCQPCSTDAFAYLTSAAGSTSIADCTCAAGYGVTPAAPRQCSMCRAGYFSAGPMARAQAAAAGQLAAASSSKAGIRSSSSSSKAPPPAPAPARPPVAKPPALPPAAAGRLRWNSTARGAQRALQQVNPVFSTPTYNPCTFCGPGCSTSGPGATSAQQCRCVFIPPLSPAPASSPSPSPSPGAQSPSPSPRPPASPSPSPSPTPSPSPGPSPSPSPFEDACIICNPAQITAFMSEQCKDATAAFPIVAAINDGSAPCYIAVAGTLISAQLTEPNNVFPTASSPLVSCAAVRTPGFAGDSLLRFFGTPPVSTAPCVIPISYQFVIPVINARDGQPPAEPGHSRARRDRKRPRHTQPIGQLQQG